MEIIEQLVGQTPGSASGTPWLLLHGAYRDAKQWKCVQAACDEAEIPSRAISLPGHGTSTMHKGELRHYSIRDYVRIVLAELENANPRPLLVGFGMGAWIALRVAEECALPGVVLVGCPPLRGSLTRALGVGLRHPLFALRCLGNGLESPWQGNEALASTLLDGHPTGPESSSVLRELLHRPVANPELVESPVLSVPTGSGIGPDFEQRIARFEADSSPVGIEELAGARALVQRVIRWQTTHQNEASTPRQ